MMKNIIFKILFLVSLTSALSCQNNQEPKEAQTEKKDKVGVLIVSHGSHSKNWRKMLLRVEADVKPDILKSGKISEVRSAFMEYQGPNIADQLKAFDEKNFDKIIIVPLFLTVSSHTASDIQNIVGVKKNPEVLASLKEEGIEVYEPKAKVVITPLLDFPGYLKKNVTRRYKALKQADNEGVVLVAYGSTPYKQQWIELIQDIGKYLKINAQVDNISYAWCGHIVRYASEPTTKAIKQILEMEQKAVVIPILVAVDEHFQGGIIQKGVDAVEHSEEKVIYKPDAILPDANINKWVIDIVNEVV